MNIESVTDILANSKQSLCCSSFDDNTLFLIFSLRYSNKYFNSQIVPVSGYFDGFKYDKENKIKEVGRRLKC